MSGVIGGGRGIRIARRGPCIRTMESGTEQYVLNETCLGGLGWRTHDGVREGDGRRVGRGSFAMGPREIAGAVITPVH